MSRYLSVGEAGRRLQVCSETIRAWFDCGKLRGVRSACGRRMVYEDDVDRLAAKGGANDGRKTAG